MGSRHLIKNVQCVCCVMCITDNRQPTCCTEHADSPLPWNGVQETDGEVTPKFVPNLTREFATVVTATIGGVKEEPIMGAICATMESKRSGYETNSTHMVQ